LRKEDELLRYLYQARHADQHSIQPLTQELIAVQQLTIPPLGSVQLRFDEKTGMPIINGECLSQMISGPRYLLLPVVNRGETYVPPTKHLGEKLSLPDAVVVAEKGMAFYEDYVRQVEAEFFPPAPADSSAAG
jgi:hypothetical protein